MICTVTVLYCTSDSLSKSISRRLVQCRVAKMKHMCLRTYQPADWTSYKQLH